MPLWTLMLPAAPSGSSFPESSRIRTSTPGNGLPIAVLPAANGSPAARPVAGDETELRRAVVLEDGGVRCPSAGRLQRARIQLRARADDGPDARGVHAAQQSAFAEQPQHGGHQHQPGDAVVGDGGVDIPDVEGFQGVEFRTGVEALGEGIQVEAGGQRSRRKRFVLPGSARRTPSRPRRTAARTGANG